MKSAYELAMERLAASDPEAVKPLTDAQREQLASIDQKYKARIAEREVFLRQKIDAARAARKHDDLQQLEEQLRNERKRLEEEAEAERDKVRNANA